MMLKEVKQWLTEYKGLNPNEVHTFAHTNFENDSLIQALHKLFDTPPFDVQELDPVCHQLYEFYRSSESKLKLFALEYVPGLIWLYLRCLSLLQRKVCGGVETFLLGVYNLEIVKSDGSPIVESFRIPHAAKASIYHESRADQQLTAQALRQLDPATTVWRSGPFPQYESFNAQNRFSILSMVMQRYNRDLDSFHRHAIVSVCQVSHRLSEVGFSWASESSKAARVTVSPALLVEMLVAVYYAMFNGHQKVALKAIESVHRRASYELYSDVILVTNALLNSHHRGNFKLSREDSLRNAKKQAIRGSAITNASFKTKKLPDDIDFHEDDEVVARLATVDEDAEPSVTKGLKAKLRNIGDKLSGDRNKNRDNSSPRGDGDAVDSVDVVVSGSGNKVTVDMLEMQPIRWKNGEGNDTDSTDSQEKGDRTSKGSSSLIFSKKYGISKSSSASPNLSHTSKKSNSSVTRQSSSNSELPSSNLNGKTPKENLNSSFHLSENGEEKNSKISNSSLSSSPLPSSSSFQINSSFNLSSSNHTESSLRPKSVSSHLEAAYLSNSHSEKASSHKENGGNESIVKSNPYFSTQL